MSQPHIVKALDQQLEALAQSICEMGEFAAQLVGDSVRALLQGHVELARQVIEQDRRLDALRRDISASAALVIARRQPLAGDLGGVLADFASSTTSSGLAISRRTSPGEPQPRRA